MRHVSKYISKALFHGFLQFSPMEIQDNNGWTPLLLAIAKCSIAACLTLMQFGANLHALDLSQRNALHLAILYGALKDESLWKRIREVKPS